MSKHYSTSVSITGTPVCDKCGKVLTYANDENCSVSDDEEQL